MIRIVWPKAKDGRDPDLARDIREIGQRQEYRADDRANNDHRNQDEENAVLARQQ